MIGELSAQEKLDAAESLYWSAWHLKAAWLKKLHPDWSIKKIDAEVKRLFKYARS